MTLGDNKKATSSVVNCAVVVVPPPRGDTPGEDPETPSLSNGRVLSDVAIGLLAQRLPQRQVTMMMMICGGVTQCASGYIASCCGAKDSFENYSDLQCLHVTSIELTVSRTKCSLQIKAWCLWMFEAVACFIDDNMLNAECRRRYASN